MKSPEYIVHGTSSEKDAKNIENTGFEAEEGRATVSTDLIMALKWSSDAEKRKASKSESGVGEGEKGRIIVMKVPDGKAVDYGEETDIEIDDDKKEVSGFVSRYENGRRYLAIYNDSDEAGTDASLSKDNILMSLVPSPELNDKLFELKEKVKNLENIDSKVFTEDILQIIRSNPDNFFAGSADPSKIIDSLVVSTVESEVVRLIRTTSIDVERVKGYKIINKDEDITGERVVEKKKLTEKLKTIKSQIDDGSFDIGQENLNRYIKVNVEKMLAELES